MRTFAFKTLMIILAVVLAVGVMPVHPAVAAKTEFELVADWITQRFADWTPTISAEALYKNLNDGDKTNDPFILSVRLPEDYAKGHIPGAYNIVMTELAKPENLKKLPTDRQIVTYCYTGDWGQVAATFLRLMGYDAVNLEYGVMGWTTDDNALASPRFAGAKGYPVETTPHSLTETYKLPELKTGMKTAQEIIQARGQALYSDPNWASSTTAETVYKNLNDGDKTNDPFILSVRMPEDYAKGHLAGAHNILWSDVAKLDNLAKLPSDRPIVVYCYSGDWGQIATTALLLLGYNTVNLEYGIMGWTNDDNVLAMPRFAGAKGYPIETTPHAFPAS
jgi:sulfur-carrier protein adenylyltransferase/sulfurtransferase